MSDQVDLCPEPDCSGTLGPDGVCDDCGAATDDGDSLDDRSPCPDGACIGIIGPDGHCTECGTFAGIPEGAAAASTDEDDDEDDWDDAPDVDEDDEGDEGDEDDEEEDREPCLDGACIGIIGSDGLCSECGRSADDPPS